MGFLKNLHNFIAEKVDQQESQSDEERAETINCLKSNEEIKDNIPIMAILDNYMQYSQIYFGDKNVSLNIRQTFLIPENEIIIAYIKGKISALSAPTAKAVITNKELYILPALASYHEFKAVDDKRIYHYPISDFCKYLITLSNGKCCFENADGIFTLIKKPVVSAAFSKNISEESFYAILLKMQDSLYKNSNSAKTDRDKLFKWLGDITYTQILCGKLENHTRKLIQIIKKETAFTYKSNLLLLLEALYYHDQEKIITNIHQFSQEMTFSDNKLFFEGFNNILYTLIKDVSNINQLQNVKYLEKVNISSNFFTELPSTPTPIYDENEKAILEVYTKYQYDIGSYLAIKKYPDIPISDISDSLKKHDSIDSESILKFAFSIRDKRMLKVFNNIKKHEKSFPVEWLSYIDSFCLTPLHYSLILKDDATTRLIMEKIDKLHTLPNETNENLKIIYHYAVLCILTNQPEYLAQIAEYYKEEDVKPLLTNRRLLNAILKTKEFALTQTNTTIRTLEKNIKDARRSETYSNLQLEEIQHKIDQFHDLKENLQEAINNTKKDIFEIENTIKSCMYSKYSEICKVLILENSIAVQLFHKIYCSADILYSCLSSAPEEREFVFIYDSQFCFNKKILQFYKNEDNTQKKTHSQNFQEKNTNQRNHKKENINKPYGNRWFSNSAYTDLNILRKEYHALAKKYHPDNCPNQDTTPIFMDIELERSIILD